MAYEGGYPQQQQQLSHQPPQQQHQQQQQQQQGQQRPYAGPAGLRPVNRRYIPPQQGPSQPPQGPPPARPQYGNGQYENHQGQYHADYYEEPAGYGPDYGPGQWQSPEYYHNGPRPGRGGRPPMGPGPPAGRMGGGGGGGGGMMPRPQTAEVGRGGGRFYPPRGGAPGPGGGGPGGRGYPPPPGPGQQFDRAPNPNMAGIRPIPQRQPMNEPLSPLDRGFGGGGPFPALPGQNKTTDRDLENKILGQMAALDMSDPSFRQPQGRGGGGGPPARGGGYGPPPRGGDFGGPRAPRGPPPPPRGGGYDPNPHPGRGPPEMGYGPPRQPEWDQGYRDNGYGPPQLQPQQPPPPRDGFAAPGRSVTMPLSRPPPDFAVPSPRTDNQAFQGPYSNSSSSINNNNPIAPPPRPSTAVGNRPPPPRRPYGPNPNQPGPMNDGRFNSPGPDMDFSVARNDGPQSQASFDDVFDAYYDNDPSMGNREYGYGTRTELGGSGGGGGGGYGGYGGGYGDGSNSGDGAGAADYQEQAGQRGSYDDMAQPRPIPGRVPELGRTKSQPDLRRSQDTVFEMAADAPSMPPPPPVPTAAAAAAAGAAATAASPTAPPSGGYQPYRPGNMAAPPSSPPTFDQSQSQSPVQDQGIGGGRTSVERLVGLPSRPSPRAPAQAQNDPASTSPSPSTNPDTLPAHPVPVRPGLSTASPAPVNPNDRPAPFRNYGGLPQDPVAGPAMPVRNYAGVAAAASPVSPDHGGAPVPGVAAAGLTQSQKDPPITADELERLRLRNRADPNDRHIALVLAKKLIEACDVLAPALADPKARTRQRDRYGSDAQKLLKKLASAQVPDAMFTMADAFGRGVFGDPDNKEAFVMYQSAAKLGHAAAAYRTAVCCEIGSDEGGGTRKDPLKAMQWYKRAATLGDPPAMYKIGMILLKGLLGQARNPREAVGWLRRAAERADAENPHALHELGLLYESASGNDAIVRDPAYALDLFYRAAELGYKFSQFRLGCAYEYGLMGCEIDPRMSIGWYSQAARQEEHQAELALSGWYLTGSEGVLQQSDTEAYLWARKAAMAGLPKAEYAMGYFTEVGIGVTANLEDAKRWYWRAAAQDFPKARERLEDLKRSGKSGGARPRERISRSKIEKQQEGECVVM